ncbi:MAG: AAA family ATPase [Prevotella sp.]|nr:AAA family ATPase [Prevotella sp.]
MSDERQPIQGIPLPGESDAKPKTPDFLQGDDWFDADISGDFLDFDKPYRPPRYTMEREGVPFADVGEIHIISGKPGNGKTGLMAQLIAATLGGQFGNTIARKVGHKVNGSDDFHELPTRILYVDTEQGEDDTIGFKNRVISMSGVSKEDAKEHLKILRLRDTELAQDRWRKILKSIWQVQPTDIFLDGMLDIVEDYNDQKECQPIIRKCMMLATHYDTSLWAVLHENPMVDKLVGTLGSITQRKVSEIFTVIKIKQADLKENDRRADLPDIYFRVKQNKARGRDVSDWLFQYVTNAGGWGQPVEIEDNGVKVADSKEIAFMKEADERLKAYNWTSSGATYTDLERYLRKSVSGRRAGDLINIAAEKGIIYKSDKKKFHYNGLKELPKDNTQDLPFEGPSNENVPY